MERVLEYITQNYTLFLFGGIIILLAIIGYYADKTNFGQNSSNKKSDNNTSQVKNSENVDLNNDSNVGIDNKNLKSNDSLALSQDNTNNNSLGNSDHALEAKNPITHTPENKKNNNAIVDIISKELTLIDSNVILNNEVRKKKEIANKKKEEEFDKLNDEFDSLLPRREIISDDLLSEIDDLELGKTQKFDLKDLKRLDNIKLPRISDTVIDEQDIWKI